MTTYIDILVSKIKQPQFYVPRDYKTIGGLLTLGNGEMSWSW